jgi:hypothetical protein
VIRLVTGVPEPNLIGDPSFRRTLREALEEAGELCFIVLWVQGAGRKDWYLVSSQAELETVLQRIRPVGPWGYSDRIEIFGTLEFPHRTRHDNEWLRERALEVVDRTGEVVLACRREGDPELYDVENTDHAGTIDEWFSEPHEGERIVGPHPFRHPDGTPGVFVAWNPNENGDVRPGAY